MANYGAREPRTYRLSSKENYYVTGTGKWPAGETLIPDYGEW